MTRVFISYSHLDEALRAELETHLSILRRQGLLDIWSDHRILPGGTIDRAISAGLEQADIVLLLVSSDFLNSDYCYSTEMTRALERRAAGECDVVPIVLRPCIWHQSPPLSGLKAIPTDGKPVIKWPSHDEAFEDIARHIVSLLQHRADRSRTATTQIGRASTISAADFAGPAAAATTVRINRPSNLALPRRFTDQDKHDFLQESFAMIRTYFEHSLRELQARNPGTEGRLQEVSVRAFQAFVFRDGRQEAACYIRIGGSSCRNSVGYTLGDQINDNSYNEMLSVLADAEKIYLSATMSGEREKKLSQDGAADYLWEKFIAPLQQRHW